MSLRRTLNSLWSSLFHGQHMDRDLDEELQIYLDGLIEKKIRAGIEPAAARREALIEMGGLTQVKAEVRRVRTGAGIGALCHDLRFAFRSLIRRPGFAAVAILTFALGIGANTAIFSVVNSVLIRPLPYTDSAQLAFVWSDMSSVGYPRAPLSGPELKDLRDRGTLFSSFAAIWANTLTITGDREPEQLRIGLVTANFFHTLGASAQLGRTFDDTDDARGAAPTILLSHALWQRRYGSAPAIVGRKIIANGRPSTVIGVMSSDFRLLLPPDSSVPEDLEAWVPFGVGVTNGPRGQQFLRVIGRMKQGVAFAQARDQIAQIAGNLSREFTAYGPSGLVLNLVGLQSDGARLIRPGLLALGAGVVILLITACMNVASLLIARAVARTRETALRLAIGASHRQIARQCLVEGLVLALAGAAAGIVFGEVALHVLLALRPEALSRLSSTRIDTNVLAFIGLVAIIWGALFSFAPMIEVFRTDVTGGLIEGTRHGGAARYRLRAVLVTLQVAFCVALLVGAGLMIRTFVSIQRLDPGYRSEHMLAFRVNPTLANVQPAPERELAINEFQQHLQSELSVLPGVTGVGAVSHLPFDNIPNWGGPYVIAGGDPSKPAYADYRSVSPGYFETVGAHLIEGRMFTEADDTRAQPVAIVDDLLARKMWPGSSAVGKQIAVDPLSVGQPSNYVTVTIVGVVRHMRLRSFVEELSDQLYLPIRQFRRPTTYVVSTSGDPSQLVRPTRDVVRRLDPLLPIYDVHLVEDNLMEARSGQRFTMILAGVFAAVALVMTFVGVFGLVSYSVSARRYEFGVRVALGARAGEIVRLVLREGIVLLTVGLMIGIGSAVVLTRFLHTQLFGVTASDPLTYAAAVAVIATTGLLACWLPARRAATSDPLAAIRSE